MLEAIRDETCLPVSQLRTWGSSLPDSDFVKNPFEHFRYFFDNQILDHIVEQSNLFATQENPSKPLQLDRRV